MYRAYKDQAQFYLVYVREAHPTDGRQARANERERIIYDTPTNLAARAVIAGDCVKNLGISMPCLLDDMSNTVERAYRAWPSRACVVDRDGKFVYVSRAAPQGVNPPEIEKALKAMPGASGAKPEP